MKISLVYFDLVCFICSVVSLDDFDFDSSFSVRSLTLVPGHRY